MTVEGFPVLYPPIRERVGPVEADLFEARVRRWWPDYVEAAADVYPEDELDDLHADVAELVARAFVRRSPRLRRRDLERMVRPDWFAEPAQVAYAAYVDRFAGTLTGARARLPYLRELGVTVLHLLPVQTPRPEPNDGGTAVADHRTVRFDLGSLDDLTVLAEDLHAKEMSLGLDLVVTHVAREHEWARRARSGRERYRRAFHVVDDEADVERLARTAPTALPGATSPFTWDDEIGGWVRTTFHPWQWDLDWSSTDVFCASLDIMCFLANLGVDVLRLVGLPHAWTAAPPHGAPASGRSGVHALLQALRAAMRIAAPSLALAAPAPATGCDPGGFVGRGRRSGREADLAARDDVAAHVWTMLATRDTRAGRAALAHVAPHPAGTAWTVAVRDHDELHWRSSCPAGNATVTSPDGSHDAHAEFLTEFYTGRFAGSFARGLPFRADAGVDGPTLPVDGVGRVSGSLASLAGVDAALEAPPGAARDRALEAAVARILLLHAVAFGWGGLPVVWSGDELGLRNDPGWAGDGHRSRDTRWVHRRALPWGESSLGERVRDRHDLTTVAGQVFTGLRHLARVRASLPQLHASVDTDVLDVPDPGVLAVVRRHPAGSMLGLYNVTERLATVPGLVLDDAGITGTAIDVLSSTRVGTPGDGVVWLAPYAARWVVTGMSPAADAV